MNPPISTTTGNSRSKEVDLEKVKEFLINSLVRGMDLDKLTIKQQRQAAIQLLT